MEFLRVKVWVSHGKFSAMVILIVKVLGLRFYSYGGVDYPAVVIVVFPVMVISILSSNGFAPYGHRKGPL